MLFYMLLLVALWLILGNPYKAVGWTLLFGLVMWVFNP